jgi:hypothetical protein
MTNAQATASLKAGFAEYLSLYGVEQFLTGENTALSMAQQYDEVDELCGLTIEEAAEIMQAQIDAAIELLGDNSDDDNDTTNNATEVNENVFNQPLDSNTVRVFQDCFAEYLSNYGVETFSNIDADAHALASSYDEVGELGGLTIDEAAAIIKFMVNNYTTGLSHADLT